MISAPCHPHTASEPISDQHRRIMCALTWASTSDWRCHAGLTHTHTAFTANLSQCEQAKQLGYVTHLSHSQWLNGLSSFLGLFTAEDPLSFFFFFLLRSFSQADAQPPQKTSRQPGFICPINVQRPQHTAHETSTLTLNGQHLGSITICSLLV